MCNIYLGVFVVHTMIPCPVPNAPLVCKGGSNHKKYSHTEARLVRAMSPKAVRSCCNSKTGKWSKNKCHQYCKPMAMLDKGQPDAASNMDK